MSEHDERMWKLLTSSPTTSCEKWAAARIKELETELSDLRAEFALRGEIEISLDRDKQRIAKAQCDGMEMAVRLLDAHGRTEAAQLVQAALDGAFI